MEAIAACTRLIASAKGRTLATAYNNRGSAYIEKIDDRAIADLNEAIGLTQNILLPTTIAAGPIS